MCGFVRTDAICWQYHRACIASFVADEIVRSSDVACPKCKKSVSMRDAKELMPQQSAGAVPTKGVVGGLVLGSKLSWLHTYRGDGTTDG